MCPPRCHDSVTADKYVWLLQNHSNWELMPIIPFPTEDRSQISGFLSSVKEVIVIKTTLVFLLFFLLLCLWSLTQPHLCVGQRTIMFVPVYHCVYRPQMGWKCPLWSSLSLSFHFTLCQPQHSGHFLHSHPLWMGVIIAKLYTHMAGHQPLKPHCNITRRSFNESLTQQRHIKGPSSLSCSEKYSDILVYLFLAFMRLFVCRGTWSRSSSTHFSLLQVTPCRNLRTLTAIFVSWGQKWKLGLKFDSILHHILM